MDLLLAWSYYSMLYIMLSILITLGINHLLKKLYFAPLIINFIAGGLFMTLVFSGVLTGEQATFSMYFHYVPVVLASIVFNTILFLIRKGRQIDKRRH